MVFFLLYVLIHGAASFWYLPNVRSISWSIIIPVTLARREGIGPKN